MPTLLNDTSVARRVLTPHGRNRSYTYDNGVSVTLTMASRASIETVLRGAASTDICQVQVLASIQPGAENAAGVGDHIVFGHTPIQVSVSPILRRGVGYGISIPDDTFAGKPLMRHLVLEALTVSINGRSTLASITSLASDLGITIVPARHVSNDTYRESFTAREFVTSGSWVDSYSLFQTVYKRIKDAGTVHPEQVSAAAALDGFDVPYMLDGGRTFGLEIEIDFPEERIFGVAKARIAQEMFDAGLSDSPAVRGWHWRGRETDNRGRPQGGGYTDARNGWSVEYDRSVDDVNGQRGCEIVSPIMSNTDQAWADVAQIVQIIKNNGGQVNARHGLHVNLGARDISHDQGVHYRMIRLTRQFDDLLIRVAHTPEVGDVHRGRSYCDLDRYSHSARMSIAEIRRYNNHRCAVNLDHVPVDGQTARASTRIEFRMFDGTLSVGRIQTNVMLSMAILHAAVRGVDLDLGFDVESAGTHQNNRSSRRRLSGDAWKEDTMRVRQFSDAMALSDEARERLLICYTASRWQRI